MNKEPIKELSQSIWRDFIVNIFTNILTTQVNVERNHDHVELEEAEIKFRDFLNFLPMPLKPYQKPLIFQK